MRKIEPPLKKRYKVYLFIKNLKTKKSKKHYHIKVRPYSIKVKNKISATNSSYVKRAEYISIEFIVVRSSRS